MANIVVVSGRMVADPELRNISEDKTVCNFRIAVPKRFKPQEGADSDFFNAVAWNRTAEFICKYFSKGKRIELVGSLQTRNWDCRVQRRFRRRQGKIRIKRGSSPSRRPTGGPLWLHLSAGTC